MTFPIKGQILDHLSNPMKGVYVDAYNAQITTYYVGTSKPTNQNGVFRLYIPDIAATISPKILLKVRDDYRLLHETTNPKLLSTVFPNLPGNFFRVKIPQEEVGYSDRISHVNWLNILKGVLKDTTSLSLPDLGKIWPGLEKPIKDSTYTTPEKWKVLKYNQGKGALVTITPKEDSTDNKHNHEIPWKPGDSDMSITPFKGKRVKIFGLENIPKRKAKYKRVTHDIVEKCDVCVIGSGAAGAILANKIARKGKKVVLIEKGGYYDGEDKNQRELSMMPLLWKNGGFSFTNSGLVIAQGECLGGSTVINDAVCFKTPKIVRQQWRDLGVNISDTKWCSAIDEVWDMINVKPVEDDDLTNNKNSSKLKDACEMKTPNRDPYKGMKNDRNCKECKTCGFCHLGCHYERKQDMVITYIREALEDNNADIKIYCNCNVDKISYENNTVTGVQGKFELQGGNEKFNLRVNAKVVVLSAGSLASSCLLLSNNIAWEKAGKELALHPATLLIGKFDEEIKASEGIPMAYSCTEFSVENQVKKGGFMIESIFTPIYQFALQLPQKMPGGTDLMNDFNHYAMAGIMVRDESNGTITLSNEGRPKVSYKFGPMEIDAFVKGVDILANLWFDVDATKVIAGFAEQNEAVINKRKDIPKLLERVRCALRNNKGELKAGSAHPQGGNRMGKKDNKLSVVDSNCKVHDFKNLFVCDASVFPTSVGVNPQITVMALATMTGDHINKYWDTKFEKIQLKDYQGLTSSLRQPMYCNQEYLETLFFQKKMDPNLGVNTLLNPTNLAPNKLWSFDKKSLIITNYNHWRGFVPEYRGEDLGEKNFDMNTINVIKNYLLGFWKKFSKFGGQTEGTIFIYQAPNLAVNLTAKKENYSIFGGDVIHLSYSAPTNPIIVRGLYDIIKIIDKDTIIGKTFWGNPPYGIDAFTFCMSRKYPAQYMDLDDHENIFANYSTQTTMDKIVGRWVARDVKSNVLDRRIVVTWDKGDSKSKKINDIKEIADKPIVEHMDSEIKKVNDTFMIGKLFTDWQDNIISKVPIHYIEKRGNKKRILIRYVLSC